jgi:hypothetical protein
MIRTLLYVEPRIDLDFAYGRSLWVQPYSLDLIKTLQRAGGKSHFEFCITLNEPLAMRFGKIEDAKIKLFTQRELFPLHIGDAVDLSIAWYKGTYSDEQMQYYVRLMKDKFHDFIPDIIITYTPAPYLQKAFPDALILHHEGSFMSRAPYPFALYMDPFGMYYGRDSFLNRFGDVIRKTGLTGRQRQLVCDFKSKCRSIIKEKSPFNKVMEPLREKFDYLVLLPLGAVRQYAFDGTTNLKICNMYQYLTYIMDRIPQNIGVVVTFVPALNPPFNSDTINFFKAHYPNFIYREEFEEYDSVSQYMLSYVDAVIGVSTGLSYQALFWDRKVIELGDSTAIADSNSLDNIQSLLQGPPADKDNLLYWILTRYVIQRQYLYDPGWLPEFLLKALDKFRSGNIGPDFYGPIDGDEYIFSALTEGLNANIPQPNINERRDLLNRYRAIKAEYDALGSRDVFSALRNVITSGEEMFQQGKVDESLQLFSRILSATNGIKADVMNNIAVIYAHKGELQKAERLLEYLVREGYESAEAERNLEAIRNLKDQL